MPGDPVAAVVAETAATAKDAADLVFVDYEPLDGAVTPTPTNPLGAKGLGEAGAIGSTPRGGQRCRRRPRGCRRPNTGDTRADLAHIAFLVNGASYLIATPDRGPQ